MSEKDNIEKLMSDKEVQFRDFKLTKIETRKDDDSGNESLMLEGLACKFNEETVLYKGKYYECREKIDASAFNEADMSDVIFNYNHCGRVYARTRNSTLSLEVKSDGLYMKATLRKDDRGHEELYNDIKTGTIDKMSFAFHVQESSYEYIENNDGPTIETRTVTKIDKLYDVSAVDIPAYDTTSISARRAFSSERSRRKTESEERVKMLLNLKLKLGGM